MYNVSELENAETYMIQGPESELRLTNTLVGQFEAMYNEAAPEFVIDQGMYYPTTANYGYCCTGFESPSDWDDHHGIFGLDGPDIQYAGAQSESFPYVYYTPTYGFAESPYNPYNPYIPGAMMGVDGQYYAMPTYQNPSPTPYIPVAVQPDIIPNSFSDPLLDTGASIANRPDGGGLNVNLASASTPFHWNPPKYTPTQTNSWTRASEGLRTTNGQSKKPVTRGSILAGSLTAPASSHAQQGRSASGSIQDIDNSSNRKVLSTHNKLKVALPASNGLSDFRSSAQGRAAVDNLRPMIHFGRVPNDTHGSQDAVNEQNRGFRTNRLTNQLAVKAYTTKAGDSNSQGNIIINTDQYNKDDFPVDYQNAKFFVIKSYSEDDVHKSIKYNVWSSTPHGNKKLDSAFEDALQVAAGKPRGCPIFLFFSVNASGQFCGVAEMIGPVDFHKDMDFWQQDKWNGCFPVKWHIIKDVSNTNFRHIILENNENKPVTNSRDTQEIMYKQGLEMLKIFKHHTLKTSLFDDFMYYENRQKIVLEEKVRPLRSFENPYSVPSIERLSEINGAIELLSNEYKKTTNDDLNSKRESTVPATRRVLSSSDVAKASPADKNAEQVAVSSTLKIGSLSINPKQDKAKPLADSAATEIIDQSNPCDVVKVGSMPLKINTYPVSSGFLTVGTIPLDPRALKSEKGGLFAKNASHN